MSVLVGGRGRRSPLVTGVVDALFLASCVVAGSLAFGPAYGNSAWLVASVGGGVLGALIGSGTALLRWHWAYAEIALIIAYFVFGAALAVPQSTVASVFPSVESIRLLSVGAVTSWKEMLSIAAPVGTHGALLVPVFLTTLVASTIACSVAARTRHPITALFLPVGVLVVAGLFGTEEGNLTLVSGGLIAVGGLIWASWRRARGARPGLDLRRWVSAAIVIGAAGAAAFFVTPFVTPAEPRVALRNEFVPPFDPADYPSPLAGFRKYVKANQDLVLFSVSGDLAASNLVRLATMDDYAGVVYNVSSAGGDPDAPASGAFTRVGQRIPTNQAGTVVQVTVTVASYVDIWLPNIGYLTSVSFGGSRSDALAEGFRYAPGTGTGIVLSKLQQGDSYTMAAIVPPEPSQEQQLAAPAGTDRLPDVRIPDKVKAAALRYTEGVDGVWAKVMKIRDTLRSTGTLSHEPASPSGHGIDRLNRLMQDTAMIGDQEQFAPAMALMLRSLGIPARVVMGFRPNPDSELSVPVEVRGRDISAWVEVSLSGIGWVPVDPTPDETNKPPAPQLQQQTKPRPKVVQPPPPSQDAQAANSTAVDDGDDNPPKEEGGLLGLIAVTAGLPVLLIGGPLATIFVLKARRRSRRRTTGKHPDRVAGGWSQLVDKAVDLGHRQVGTATRSESALAIDERFGTSTVMLAQRADAEVFGPHQLTDEDVARFWAEVDSASSSLAAGQSRWQRLRARFSIASLRLSQGGRRSRSWRSGIGRLFSARGRSDR
jgi:transglutaminase-like putative cysteine protease